MVLFVNIGTDAVRLVRLVMPSSVYAIGHVLFRLEAVNVT